MMTACKHCKHMLDLYKNVQAGKIWYSFKCAAVKNEPLFDPIEGTYEEPEYKYCREVNGGNCVFFEVK